MTFDATQAGGSGDALEIAVPAAITRLFKHPSLDWGLLSPLQRQLNAQEVHTALWGSGAEGGKGGGG